MKSAGIKKGISWLIITSMLYECVRFGGVAILARLLDPEDFGVVGIATMVTAFAERISSLGLMPTLIQKKQINENHLSTAFSVSLITRFAAFLVLFLSSSYIGAFFDNDLSGKVIAVLSFALIILPFVDIPTTLLKRELRFQKYGVLILTIGLFSLLCSICLALMGFGVWSLVYGNLLGLLLQWVVLTVLRVWMPKFKYSHASMKDIFSFSGWMYLKTQIDYITQNADYFVIGKVLGTVRLGFYERAFSLMMLPYRRITKNINTVLFSSFSRAQEELGVMKTVFRKVILSASLLSSPMMIGLLLVAPEFVQILLGPKWTPIVGPLQILCIAGIFTFMTGVIISVIKARGLAKPLVCYESISALILVAGVMVGIRKDITGVSIAVVCYSIFRILLLVSLLVSRVKGIRWGDFFSSQIPSFIGAFGMAMGVEAMRRLLSSFLSTSVFMRISILGISGGLIYISILLSLKSEDVVMLRRELINDVKSVLKELLAKKVAVG